MSEPRSENGLRGALAALVSHHPHRQHGAWCDVDESTLWPCPWEKARRLLALDEISAIGQAAEAAESGSPEQVQP